MQVRPINLSVYGTWGALLLVCGLFSGVKVSDTIALWNSRRASADAHQQDITAIERATERTQAEIEAKGQIDQAYIDSRVDQFSSVRITNYICDPSRPPQGVDWSAYADEGRQDVTDRTGRIIGYTEGGAFAFIPDNCNP